MSLPHTTIFVTCYLVLLIRRYCPANFCYCLILLLTFSAWSPFPHSLYFLIVTCALEYSACCALRITVLVIVSKLMVQISCNVFKTCPNLVAVNLSSITFCSINFLKFSLTCSRVRCSMGSQKTIRPNQLHEQIK